MTWGEGRLGIPVFRIVALFRDLIFIFNNCNSDLDVYLQIFFIMIGRSVCRLELE